MIKSVELSNEADIVLLASEVLPGVLLIEAPDLRLAEDDVDDDDDEEEIFEFKVLFKSSDVLLPAIRTLAGSIAPISPRQEPNLIKN